MDDPNNTNTSPVDAGANDRQAIFTPQPEAPTTPETPVISTTTEPTPQSLNQTPAPSPAPVADNPTHPFLSNHPTQTFNSNTGDIILGGAAPKTKQNKRPFIIGAIVLLVVLIICAAILIYSNTLENRTVASVETKFNEFSSYLENKPEGGVLYGERSEVQAYLQTSWQKFNEFYESYGSRRENTDTELGALIENYRDNFDLVYHIYNKPNLTSAQLFDAYIDIPNDVVQKLKDYYQGFLESSSSNVRAYGEKYIAAGETLLKAYRVLSEYGCIDEENTLRTCDDLPEELQSVNNAVIDFQSFYLSADAEYNQAVEELFQDLDVIKEELEK